MSLVNLFGMIAFITSVIGLIPQVVKSLQTRSTRDVSMIMLVNYVICSIAWVCYGFYTDSLYVLFSNILGLSSSLFLVIIKMYYDQRPQDVCA